jgi:tetratricopeptide (TPR) repeat protein
LASQIGESPELSRVLAGVATAYLNKGDLTTAVEVAQDALAAAERTGDAADLLSAHSQVGFPLVFQGHLSRALAHFERTVELYNPTEHGSLAYTIGFDYGSNANAYAAFCHVYRGHADRARALSEAAVALARRVEHPLSLEHALLFAGIIHRDCGQIDRAREYAEEVVDIAERLGFPFYLRLGRWLRGSVRVESGEGEVGIAEMQQAIVELAALGSGGSERRG